MKKYSCAVATKTGRRPNNQDNYMLAGQFAPLDHDYSTAACKGKTSAALFAAVCDGMGGEASGERASFEACSALAEAVPSLTASFDDNKSIIREAIIKANDRICDVMQQENAGRMGSTMIGVLLQDDKLYYTNLGDSRIYLVRGGKLYQLTKDHTEGQAMVDAGVLTPEQLKTHPSRNKLSLHLGIFEDEMSIEPAKYADIDLANNDRLLLCSDGVFGVMQPEELVEIVSGSETVEERAAKLIERAYSNGSKDNMTAMVIDVQNANNLLIPLLIGGISVLAVAVALGFMIKKLHDEKTADNRDKDRTATEAPTDEPTGTPGADDTDEPSVTPGADETPGPTDDPTSHRIHPRQKGNGKTNNGSAETDPPETEAPETEVPETQIPENGDAGGSNNDDGGNSGSGSSDSQSGGGE